MKDYFEGIVGYEEIKRELRIISDMLSNPEVYQKLGAGINDGLVLCGKPGTGKTTMANCLIESTGRKAYICRKKASDGKFIKTISDTFEEATGLSEHELLSARLFRSLWSCAADLLRCSC